MPRKKLNSRLTIRLDRQTDKALSDYAERLKRRKSDLIREVLADFEVAYTLLKDYQLREHTRLEDSVTQHLLERLPETPPEVFEAMTEAVARATEIRKKEWELKQKKLTEVSS